MGDYGVTFVDEFRKAINEIWVSEPSLVHYKADLGSSVTVKFPKADSHGFDVVVSVEGNCLSIQTDLGWHTDEFDITMEELNAMLGLVRDMLSSAMRIREFRAGGLPHRWNLEFFDGKEWILEETVGLWLWNFLGKRSERVFQNSVLPARAVDN